MPHTKRPTHTIKTTVGELAAAFYEAAFAELKDEATAAKLAQRLVQDAVQQKKVSLA